MYIDPRDGKQYQVVKLLDGRWWFAQNLNFETFLSKWALDFKNTDSKFEEIDPKFSIDEQFYDSNLYGRLYTWHSAQEACPSGWHVPSREEWRNMLNCYGGFNGFLEHDTIRLVLWALRRNKLFQLVPEILKYRKIQNSSQTKENPDGALITSRALRYGSVTGFNLMRGGFCHGIDDEYLTGYPYQGIFWSSDLDYFDDTEAGYIYRLHTVDDNSWSNAWECIEISTWMFSVRCIKDL